MLELDRDDVNDCATFIGDSDGPRRVAIRSVQETITEFHCGLICGSLSCHRVTKIDALLIPHGIVESRLNVKEVTRHRNPKGWLGADGLSRRATLQGQASLVPE